MRRTMRALTLTVVAFVFMGASGCATMGSWFGMASEEYVDEQVAAVQADVLRNSESIRDNSESITAVGETVDEIVESAASVEEALISVEQAVTTTEELKQLADVLEDRLEDLPRETIRQLIGILETYLDSER